MVSGVFLIKDDGQLIEMQELLDTLDWVIQEIRENIIDILRKHQVKRASLFGSVARGETTEDSDVDLSGVRGQKEPAGPGGEQFSSSF